MKTSEQGLAAETAVAKLLTGEGYKILDRNWRTPRCEIDLVASRGKTIYFCEVKYRSSPAQGEGFDYITPKKQNQMQYAAELWCVEHGYDGNCLLLAAEVSGLACENIALVEIS